MRRTPLLIATALFICAAQARATMYVTTNGTGNGSSWAQAASLKSALATAASGETLWIAAGTYTDDTDGNNSFVIGTANLALYGGFTNGAAWGDRDPAAFATVLDGESLRRVLDITAAGVTLDGLTLQYGKRTADSEKGCGLRKINTGALTMANCTVRENRAGGQNGVYGFGAYLQGGSVSMTNCAIVDNEANGTVWNKGIGIYAKGVTLSLVDCALTNNARRSSGYATDGGAIYMEGGSLAATNCLFTRNKPIASHRNDWGDGSAAAIAAAADAVFKNCVFHHNTVHALHNYQYGGTIKLAADAGNVSVEQCTFAHNTPGKQGGAIKVLGGNLTVRDCILWTNAATSAGSEIYVAAGNVSVDYTCLSGTGPGQVAGIVTLGHTLTNDPAFAGETDFHLRSSAGRWDPQAQAWTNDAGAFSPGIDAGDPASDYSREPANNGGRANIGAYANTWQASRSPAAAAPSVVNRGTATNMTAVTLTGELTGGTRAYVRFHYGTNAADLSGMAEVYPAQEIGSVFEAYVTGLAADTTYFYAAFATNAAGHAWAATNTFVSGPEPPGGGATIIHVDGSANGANNGRNWFDAFTSMSAALAAVNAGTNEIWIAAGTYAAGAELDVTRTASLYGGFTGSETSRSQRSLANEVTLSGNLAYRVLKASGGDVLLDGIAIRNGYQAGDYSTGAGIRKTTGCTSLTLANCTIAGNTGANNWFYGVGAHFEGGSVTLTNCTVAHNQPASGVWNRGIGLYGKNAAVRLIDCAITNNVRLTSGNATDGGAFYMDGGSLTATNCLFIGNNCVRSHANNDIQGGAGGVIGAGAAGAFRNCIFRHNTVYGTGSSIDGGTIKLAAGAGSVTVENCTLAYNSPGRQGGAFRVLGGSLTVRNSILWSNEASVAADEIYLQAGSATVTYNCLTGVGADQLAGPFTPQNTITNNPLFASDTDLHLRSSAGRWDPVGQTWTNDAAQFSPCIDSGDPASDYSREPAGENGGRVNLGAYGNTAEASKTPPAAPPVVADRGAVVNYTVADLSAELTAGTQSDAWFFYGTNATGLAAQSSVQVSPSPQTGYVFTVRITGLQPLSTHYYACFVTNASGTDWSATNSFLTGPEPAGGGSHIIHVDCDAVGAETGRNWLDAFKTLHDAAAVNDGTNEIWVADGTYLEGSQLVLDKDVSIYGGFTGSETARTQRTLGNVAVLDGNEAYRVIDVTASNVLIDGLTLWRGRSDDGVAEGCGIRKQTQGTLELLNCRILENTSSGNNQAGSGAHFHGCSVSMSNCVVAKNTMGSQIWNTGIGLYANNAALTMVDCVVTNNGNKSGTGAYSTRGGGMYLVGGSLHARGCLFADNDAINSHAGNANGGGGGSAGYFAAGANAVFSNCVFRQNSVMFNGGTQDGGTFFVDVGAAVTVRVESCTFAYNTPGPQGGAFRVLSGNVDVHNSILWANTADSGVGHEIWASNSTVTVTYSDITGTGSPYVYTVDGASADFGAGVLTEDPIFASSTDMHLQSKIGRWTGPGTWTADALFSPCIDAGDPASDFSHEPAYNGRRINLGAYGNTAQASLSARQGTLIMLK